MKRKSGNIISNTGNALIVFALIALSGCATERPTQPIKASAAGAARFDAVDANSDGKLSRDEASDFLVSEIFESRDANNDGKMSQEEWTAGDSALVRDFKKRDANRDGVVEKPEAIAYGRAHGVVNNVMEEADTDRDGYLQRSEVTAYYASREGPIR